LWDISGGNAKSVDWIGFIEPPLIRGRQFIAASEFHKAAKASR
jgi:hypothetical protein